MAQHDMNIANQGFPATRADLNNALQALASNNSGTSAPSTTFANQWFYNTSSNKLFIRNEANNAFIEVATLDQTNNEWQITTGVIQAKDNDGLALKTDDGTTRLFINDSGGEIGIGTTSPVRDIDLRSAITTSYGTTTQATAGTNSRIFNFSNNNGVYSSLSLSANNAAGATGEFNICNVSTSTNYRGVLAFQSRTGASSWNELMRIHNNGTLCVNTSSATPGSGAIQASPLNGVALGTNGSSTYFAGAFYYGGTLRGGISTATTGTTFLTNSDKRLKDNINPIIDGTKKIMAMNPVTHTWKSHPENDAVHGFIAQEMESIAPEAVHTQDDGDKMMSMDYGRITPILVAALQDAHKKIDELETRLTELETK